MDTVKTEETITCCRCGKSEEYLDDHKTVDCMPDGLLIGEGLWVCDNCMTDDERGA